MIVFDIETGPLPEDQLRPLCPEFFPPPAPGEFDPDAVKCGNIGGPMSEKGRAKIKDAQAAHKTLVADYSRWWLVLEAAYRLDGQDPDGVYGVLSGLRCCGARLEIAGPANWSLTAEGPPPTWKLTRGEEMTEAEYQGYRQTYLVPHTAAIRKLLNAPEAGQLAQQRPATPTPDKFTGQAPATATAPAPRKNGASIQPALLAVAPVPAPATMVGGDW